MGKLSTHVLDTLNGIPAQGIHIELYTHTGTQRQLVARAVSNAQGRCDEPLLQNEAFLAGQYELVFHTAEYFRTHGATLPDPPFLDQVSIVFGVANPEQNYHVPLVVTPWSYSTYRGS